MKPRCINHPGDPKPAAHPKGWFNSDEGACPEPHEKEEAEP